MRRKAREKVNAARRTRGEFSANESYFQLEISVFLFSVSQHTLNRC